MRAQLKRIAVLAAAIASGCLLSLQGDGGSALAAVKPLIINTGSNNQWTSTLYSTPPGCLRGFGSDRPPARFTGFS